MTAVTTVRVNDRRSIIFADSRRGAHPGAAEAAGLRLQQQDVADYDAHIHRELTALLGAAGATIRTSRGRFARIDNLDHAFASIAAVTRAAAMDPCSPAALPPPRSASHATKARK
jgi:hypothetical protein